jgi:DNA-binding transcriptional LysR family regulator
MTLRHLRIFICVCKENNMTKAAAVLHISQPSISQAIHELEEHYGVRLFERLGHRLILSPAGQCLLTYTHQMTGLNAQIESAMQNMRETCPLRIGASVTVGEAFLVELLKYMKEREPEQEIFSEIHNTTELEAMLLDDTLDIALVEGVIHSEYIPATPFTVDELIFISAAENPICRKAHVTINDLQEQKFFIREAGSGTRNLFEAVMTEAHVAYTAIGVYNNAESLKRAIEANLGISVISRRSVQKELQEKRLSTFTVEGLSFQRTFRIAHHKDKYISPQLQKLIDACHYLGKTF